MVALGVDSGAAGGLNSAILRFNPVLILARLGRSTVGALLASRFQHLTGKADRLAALGGSREVFSSMGSGTTIPGDGPGPEYTS